MWFGLINEIKFWFIRTFKTRNSYFSRKDMNNFAFSWSDDEIPQWVKDTDKSKFEFTIDVEDNTDETLDR